MTDLEKLVKDVLLGGVGAVATVAEKSGEIAKALVEKGRATVKENQDAAEELKRKWKEACPVAKQDAIDVSSLTAEQRAELRRQLDLIEEEERGDDHDTQDDHAGTDA